MVARLNNIYIKPKRIRRNFTKKEINDIRLFYYKIEPELPKNYLQLIADKFGRKKITIAKLLERHGIYNKFHRKKYDCDDNYFSIIDRPNKAYWLGFIAADGNISQGKRMLSIAQHEKDEEILYDFLNDIRSNSIVYKRLQNHKKSVISRIQIYSDKIVDDLNKHGILPNKTFNLRWNECTRNIPEKFKIDFVRGYFDGDGSWKTYRKNNIAFNISGASKLFMQGMLSWLEKTLGLKRTKLQTKNLRNRNGLYEFYSIDKTAKEDIIKLFNAFYPSQEIRYLRRKFIKIKTNIEEQSLTIS